MTQFHEGQEVEVSAEFNGGMPNGFTTWRKAKIVQIIPDGTEHWDSRDGHEVQFPDGHRAVFNADHIRATESRPSVKTRAEHTYAMMEEGYCKVRWFETREEAHKDALDWNCIWSDVHHHAEPLNMGCGWSCAVYDGCQIGASESKFVVGYL